MGRVFTHYDNLKVTRNAPPEVIRAAYKTLSQKYHPDRNPGDAQAARIMTLINASYEVLSDPVKRRDYDLRLERQEQASADAAESNPQPQPTPRPKSQELRRSSIDIGAIASNLRQYWVAYGLFAIFIWLGVAAFLPRTPLPGPKPYSAEPAPEQQKFVAPTPGDEITRSPTPGRSGYERPSTAPNGLPKTAHLDDIVSIEGYERPSTAPNGLPWPTTAGYVQGYKRVHADGLSVVTVDNSQNDSDVFVKLVSLAGEKAYPVRQFFIPARGKFTVGKVTTGPYDIRYRDLSSGSLSRTESFTLEERPTGTGTEYSTITMTLYKVRNGNMRTYPLSDNEF